MTSLPPLTGIAIEPIVRSALLEDLGKAGDLTSDAIVPLDHKSTFAFRTRQSGVLAGLDLVAYAFLLVDQSIDMRFARCDGSKVMAGETIATVSGPARGMLAAERTALNFLCHLSGIATATAEIVEAVRGQKAKIVCTRKTTPGLRALEKYAVRAGGGANHRFGLDDAMLIKDNHIATVGDVRTAIERARATAGHMVKIEVEVDTLEQLDIALATGVDAVLLDNMSVEQLTQAVAMVGGRAITEASGGVTVQTAPAIAATGVDLISVGWITHSAPVLDIGLDVAVNVNKNNLLN
ncbi:MULTISPECIES: carboxylating nicotinate-nucleotide diphosphorylase [unclassified Mesorhizobium]|uniref:carboxylating nicotinate-nucleotide diphosphorylase n=1 Tax=unclassified Mesorhizobium TaxID=325217 RepID=UPI002414DC5A|nr:MULTISPECIES: carboxylating nicotinate-nucleotide diphosphorylase [unclassified Mesorhizobium]MDG4889904.1 carboxylating nicotinate-nucleotide diphosphorylase [Mesorhizobium sp. WSM4887]MDG4904047.1 carboxylating nicotinate-nucleotide diphosphorylase [Mesorhizobium sp. WSM4962]MDG4909074.1 carboxylating nicotinate-nucleotide diphosphorylase [Mesorhizobium sp. WSM4898]MDG4921698.1 carboxylating nicotinate-nucleotide diphosphorylase [Mesorhizobium sp. WSM4989]